MLQALIMGTRDYVTKCGFRKVVVGLSGGIDSALTLISPFKPWARQMWPPSLCLRAIRHGRTTRIPGTRQLAGQLGVAYSVIPIDAVYGDFVHLLLPTPPCAGRTYDPAGTSRRSGPAEALLLMGCPTTTARLLAVNGDQSKLAVGYCTLYGDMNGGLAVISDVYKTQVYDICRLINAGGETIRAEFWRKRPLRS